MFPPVGESKAIDINLGQFKWCSNCNFFSGLYTCDDVVKKCDPVCKTCVAVPCYTGCKQFRCADTFLGMYVRPLVPQELDKTRRDRDAFSRAGSGLNRIPTSLSPMGIRCFQRFDDKKKASPRPLSNKQKKIFKTMLKMFFRRCFKLCLQPVLAFLEPGVTGSSSRVRTKCAEKTRVGEDSLDSKLQLDPDGDVTPSYTGCKQFRCVDTFLGMCGTPCSKS
ncbi:hypothetical protein ACP4OV_022368 [Aristida adscensionis]